MKTATTAKSRLELNRKIQNITRFSETWGQIRDSPNWHCGISVSLNLTVSSTVSKLQINVFLYKTRRLSNGDKIFGKNRNRIWPGRKTLGQNKTSLLTRTTNIHWDFPRRIWHLINVLNVRNVALDRCSDKD